MRQVLLILVALCAVATSAAAQVQATPAAQVIGYVYTANNSVIVDADVQLRDTVRGAVAGATKSNAAGEFRFTVPPGSYVIELVNAAGGVMALGHPFTVAAGETVATFVRLANSLPIVIPSSWEVAAGVVGSWRDGSRGGAPGLSVMAGHNFGRPALVAELSGVRRAGHNDWRILGGLRFTAVERSRLRVSAQALAGTLIRNGGSGVALAAGVGAEVRGTGRVSFRVQADVTRDRANGRRADGVRASAWVVVR